MEPIYTILYVSDVQKSLAFYRSLFALEPVESSPGFAMFVLKSGLVWGLWQRDNVDPSVSVSGGGAEYCIRVESKEALDSLAEEWRDLGVSIAQEPTVMDFGYTFVGLDPDGHRLRPMAPAPHTVAAQS